LVITLAFFIVHPRCVCRRIVIFYDHPSGWLAETSERRRPGG
jgi:hypothetical protein